MWVHIIHAFVYILAHCMAREQPSLRVQQISAEQTRDLRSRVLRPGQPIEQCSYPEDTLFGSFHLGCFRGDELLGIASFNIENLPDTHHAYRLRGMAVEPTEQGRGIGGRLLAFALEYLTSLGCDVLWCNARTNAVPFYHKLGFTAFSDEFEIAGIGPHYKMKRLVD